MRPASTSVIPFEYEGKLLKILGVGFGLAVAVGGAIGGGILRNPGIVAANLGSEWLVIGAWTLGGVFSLIGANTYAELATAVPQDGGPYVFIRRAYGDFWGFAGGMNDFVQNCCATAYLSIAFGEFLGSIVPAFAGRQNIVAIVLIFSLAGLNWNGVRAGELAQKITSFAKVAAFAALALACFVFGSRGSFDAQPVTPVFSLSSPLLIFGGVALAMNSVMATYSGWYAAAYFSEENKNCSRSMPRALMGGVLVVMAVYLLVNAALLYAMPIGNIAASKLPAADVAASIIGDFGGTLITCLALCSIIGILNAALMYVPRTLFAVSRDGFLPARIAEVNSGGTPATALFLTVVLSLAFAMSGTYETLLEIATFLVLTGDSAVYLALFVLRRNEPDLARPYRAFGYPILPAIVLLGAWFLLGLFVVGNTGNSLYAIGILFLMYPVYLVLRVVMRRHPISGT
jgi:APA family basic amino acid/polyamine antiporter